jgi:hypothetical protein
MVGRDPRYDPAVFLWRSPWYRGVLGLRQELSAGAALDAAARDRDLAMAAAAWPTVMTGSHVVSV